MESLLGNLLEDSVLVYLDDIIIFSTSLQEHLERLKQVFDRLRKHNFKLRLDKCEFLRKEVDYLGHVITTEGIKPNPNKVACISNYKLPSKKKQLKGFLG